MIGINRQNSRPMSRKSAKIPTQINDTAVAPQYAPPSNAQIL
jgi:hypothetical protein